ELKLTHVPVPSPIKCARLSPIRSPINEKGKLPGVPHIFRRWFSYFPGATFTTTEDVFDRIFSLAMSTAFFIVATAFCLSRPLADSLPSVATYTVRGAATLE